jgi:hypothetical protein
MCATRPKKAGLYPWIRLINLVQIDKLEIVMKITDIKCVVDGVEYTGVEQASCYGCVGHSEGGPTGNIHNVTCFELEACSETWYSKDSPAIIWRPSITIEQELLASIVAPEENVFITNYPLLILTVIMVILMIINAK